MSAPKTTSAATGTTPVATPAAAAGAAAAPRPRRASSPVARFLVLLIQVLAVLVMVRIWLILLGANADHPIVAAVLALTDPFAVPFEGMFPQPADESGVLPIDLGALIGIGVLEAIAVVVHAVGERTRDLP